MKKILAIFLLSVGCFGIGFESANLANSQRESRLRTGMKELVAADAELKAANVALMDGSEKLTQSSIELQAACLGLMEKYPRKRKMAEVKK